jgi:tetratricopeptide (TPR) repeat protein
MSDNQHRSKTFIRSLILFHQKAKSTEAFLKDKRMTQEEKNILKGWYLLRKNKLNETIDLMTGISGSENELVNAQKQLLMGIVYNNLGQLKLAEENLINAPEILKNFKLTPLLIIAYYNLFICYFNQEDSQKASKILSEMEKLRPDNIRHKIMFKQCLLMNSLLLDDKKNAKEILLELDKEKDNMSESMKIGHAYDKLNFYLVNKDLKACLNCLGEIKKCRSFQLSDNYTYLKIFLEHLVLEAPIYVYPHQFKANQTFYLHLRFIQSLAQVDINSAKDIWEKLVSTSPEIYSLDYSVKDKTSLISYALEKYRPYLAFETYRKKIESESAQGNKEKVLYDLLTSSQFPLSKEFIHKIIWGNEISEKQDMTKLKKLVSRVRKTYQIEIRFQNNCYSIIQN